MIFERILLNEFLRDFDLEWISGNNFLTALSPNVGPSSSLEKIKTTPTVYIYSQLYILCDKKSKAHHHFQLNPQFFPFFKKMRKFMEFLTQIE